MWTYNIKKQNRHLVLKIFYYKTGYFTHTQQQISTLYGACKKYQFYKKIEEEQSEEPSKEEVIRNLKRGFEEMQLFKKRKLKATSAKDFLNEL